MSLQNFRAAPVSAIAAMEYPQFLALAAEGFRTGGRAAAFFAVPENGAWRLALLLAFDAQSRLEVLTTRAEGDFRSLTPDFPQLHLFEREIHENTGLEPIGHPWLKPVRFTAPGSRPGVADFFRVHGAEVHEVAVGPVHAGVIEPGHFRFQCHGEEVFHLEISLGYQHRGIEKRMAAASPARALRYAETLAGDTTIGHAWAWCGAIEALSGTEVPRRAQALRGIMLELERLANHTGDLGALAGDVAYLPTANYCGRLRGEYLNMTALICGNRFGRNMLKPGGVSFDLDPALIKELKLRLAAAYADTAGAVGLLWDTATVRDRFQGAGTVPRKAALELGLVGPAARASGVGMDTRGDFPYGPYANFTIPVSGGGDVQSRAYVRWLEIQRSADLVNGWLDKLPEGPVESEPGPLAPESFAVALTEGWRGQICHVAITGRDGRLRDYKIVDPSFHNWQGLALALRDGQISDFPLCNKSFNLSYCGHDL